ncbi:MAG: biopolymer transport protein ExbB/TolQ [Bacteriovoracaceae bacterium]|jgi:biopolymer transport protein ExbB/TolQ
MNIVEQFQAGGFFMYFILLFLVLTVVFIFERFYALYATYKAAPTDFRNKLLTFIGQGDYKSAKDFAEADANKSSLSRVAAVGIKMRSLGAGDEALQARMDEQLSKEISSYDKRTGFLAMFGNVSTLFGLLGTVTGLISSFAGVAAASPVERANLLSQGISEALNSTAFGLVAAIPALVAYAIYQNRTEKIVSSLTESASEIYHDLLFYTESHSEEESMTPLKSSTDSQTDMTRN